MNEEQEAFLQTIEWRDEAQTRALAAIEAGITKEEFLGYFLSVYDQAWANVMTRLQKEN